MRILVCALISLTSIAWAAAAYAQPGIFGCADPDSIYAVVQDSTIIIYHQSATYDCCPEGFDYSVTQWDSLITVQEMRVGEEFCACLCCFDLSVEIGPVVTGDYVVDFSWWELETYPYQWEHRLLDVTVPSVGQSGRMTVVSVSNSGCLGDSSRSGVDQQESPEADNSTWGSIKALFR